MNGGIDTSLMPLKTKEYKVFLVEVDDEDRERVLSGLASHVDISVEPQYADIHTFDSHYPVSRFATHDEVTVTLKLRTREDGTYFVIENFLEDDEDES